MESEPQRRHAWCARLELVALSLTPIQYGKWREDKRSSTTFILSSLFLYSDLIHDDILFLWLDESGLLKSNVSGIL